MRATISWWHSSKTESSTCDQEYLQPEVISKDSGSEQHIVCYIVCKSCSRGKYTNPVRHPGSLCRPCTLTYSFTSIQRFLTAGRRSEHYLLYLNKDIFLNTSGNSWEISQNLPKAMESNGKTPIVFNNSSSWKEKMHVALLSASHQIPVNFV